MKEAVVAREILQLNRSECWLPAVGYFAAFILLMLVDLCCCFPQGKGKDIGNEGKICLAGLKSSVWLQGLILCLQIIPCL